jgi:tetratricopeptide (TPR) repeat protein
MELDESERLAKEALELSQQSGDAHGRAYAMNALGRISWTRGGWQVSQSYFEKSLTISSEAGDAYAAEMARWWLCAASLDGGDYERARELGRDGVRRARRIGLNQQVTALCCLLGFERLVQRHYQQAEALLLEGYDATEVRSLWHSAELALGRACAARGQGRPELACQELASALRFALKHGYTVSSIRLLPAAALLAIDAGDPERAVELWALASRYPHVANSRWFEDVAGKEIAGVAAALPPEVVAAAQERGRARDLGATVQELLAELEEGLNHG